MPVKDDLPSIYVMFARFFHHIRIEKLSIQAAARSTAKELLSRWKSLHIPTMALRSITEKIKRQYNKWTDLTRHKLRKKTKQDIVTFKLKLHNLFDISKKNALKEIQDENVKRYLISQIKGGNKSRSTTRMESPTPGTSSTAHHDRLAQAHY